MKGSNEYLDSMLKIVQMWEMYIPELQNQSRELKDYLHGIIPTQDGATENQ